MISKEGLWSQCSWAVVAHAFNPRTCEAEAGRSLWVQDQSGLQELVSGQAPKLQGCLKKKIKKIAVALQEDTVSQNEDDASFEDDGQFSATSVSKIIVIQEWWYEYDQKNS